MGIATLIIFVVIILVATITAVVIIQATNVVKNQAQSTSQESSAKLSKRLTPDIVYFIVDQNRESPTYKKAIAMWIQVRVPKYGSPVDLRKTTMILETPNYVKYATYIDADGDDVFGDNACDTKSPYPTNDPKNPGDVDYNALTGDNYTAVWINCDGKNEDYLVYPGQIAMVVYAMPEGLEEDTHIKVTFGTADGGKYTFETDVPEFANKHIVSIPV